MAFKKISAADLEGKGVVGQADVPGLPAREMQEKIEEIVRSVVIPVMNDNIDEAEKTFATKSDVETLEIESGSVSSVFGRNGKITAQPGDYTAEMVGAAKEIHAARHKSTGEDPIFAQDIGAAKEEHSHGDISSDGKIGIASGLVVMTGVGGKLEAKNKTDSGLVSAPERITGSGSISVTIQDNKDYYFSGVTSLNITGAEAEAHGFIFFGTSAPSVTVSGFAASSGDDIAKAASSEVWEFSICDGYIIWKNWSA